MRRVWPIDVGRKYSPESEFFHQRGESGKTDNNSSNLIHSKEECANRTLSNIIRQLADLGKKSHEIFGKTFAAIVKFIQIFKISVNVTILKSISITNLRNVQRC